VPTFSIDTLREEAKIPNVHFLKLDVEGAELKALAGAEGTIAEDKPRICIEAATQELFCGAETFLQQWGYLPYVFNDRGKLQRFDLFRPMPNVFFLI